MKYLSSLILVIIYLIGFIGLHSSYQPYFLKLTSLNLIISSLIIFFKPIKQMFITIFHSKKPSRQAIQPINLRTILIYTGFYLSFWLIELIGVYTGFPFGHYHYGDNLGFKVLDIPLIIGLNWLLLLCVSEKISNNSLITASIMVFIDILIEQHADTLGYWFWQDGTIPLSNYIAWFFISLAASLALKALDLEINISRFQAFTYILVLSSFFYFMTGSGR